MVPRAVALMAQAEVAPDVAAARALLGAAVAVAPGDPRVRAARALAALTTPREPQLAASELVAAGTALARDPWVQGVWVPRAAAVLCAGALAVAGGLLLAGLAWAGPLLLHDYRDSFPRTLRRWTPLGFGLLAASAAWLAGAGPALLGLALALLLAPYLRRVAARTLAVTLGLGALLPLALGWAAGAAGPGGDRGWALYRVWKGDGGAALERDLVQAFGSEAPRGSFARAQLARRADDLPRAERLLLAASGVGGLAALELGNVRYLLGRTADAAADYGRAAEADPRDPVPWLNQHVVHLSRLELAAADEALARARALDPRSVERLPTAVGGAEGRLHPVSPGVPPGWVRAELWGGVPGGGWADGLRAGLYAPAPWATSLALAVASVLGVVALGQVGRRHRSQRCPTCGEVVCPRCSRRIKGEAQCGRCWVATRAADLDAGERSARADRARQWSGGQARRRRAGEVLLPGWWAIGFERAPGGVILGTVWALGLGWAAVAVLYPAPLFPWGGVPTPWGGLGVVVAAHGVALLRATVARR